MQVGDLPTWYTTALPCILPLLAHAPGYLSLFVDVYPGLLLVSGTVALPTLGAYVELGVALPRPCAFNPKGRAEYGSSLPTFIFGSATRGQRTCDLDTPLQALTRLPQGCYRLPCSLGALPLLLHVEAFTGWAIHCQDLRLDSSPAALDLREFPHETQGDLHPFIRTEPLGLKFERIPKDHFRVAHFPFVQWVERGCRPRAPVATGRARLRASGHARPGYCRVAKPEVAPGQPYNSVASRIIGPTDGQTLPLSYITLLYILNFILLRWL